MNPYYSIINWHKVSEDILRLSLYQIKWLMIIKAITLQTWILRNVTRLIAGPLEKSQIYIKWINVGSILINIWANNNTRW